MWKRGSRSRLVLALGLFLVGMVSSGPEGSRAQSHSRIDRPISFPNTSDTEPPPPFGRVLLGGTVGTGVGTGVGLLLMKAAAEAVPSDESSRSRNSPEQDAAATLTLIGVAAIVAGGPIGAVEVGGIEQRRRDAYVGAGVGEVLFGAMGYLLARSLSDATVARVCGLGIGVAAGAGGGAYLMASRAERDGLFNYKDGRWQMASPEVRVRPSLTTDRQPSVGVTLVAARF
jgi:hypothetical protein